MNLSLKKILLSFLVAGSALLVGGCVGYVDGGPDYYGPAYGGAVYYGHPWYGGDVFIGGPGRGWRR